MKKVLSTYETNAEQNKKDAYNNGDAADNLDEDNFELFDLRIDFLKKIIGETIKDYKADAGSQYYIALIEIEQGESMTAYEREEFEKITDVQIQELISRTLLSVLRKRDMFVTFRKNLAIAILYGVRPEYTDSLKTRIGNVFNQNIEHNIKLAIQILPVVDVE